MHLIFVKIGQPMHYFFIPGVILISFSKWNGCLLLLNPAKHLHIFSFYLFNLLLSKCHIQSADVVLWKRSVLLSIFIKAWYLFKQQPVLSFNLSIFGLHEIMLFRVLLVHVPVSNCLIYFANTFSLL